MANNWRFFRIGFLLLIIGTPPQLLVAQVPGASHEHQESYIVRPPIPNSPRDDGLWPGLRVRDALAAVRLLRFQRYIMEVLPNGKRRTVNVQAVDMGLVELERLPPPYADGTYESRWDLLLQGRPIDPRNYAIYYGGKIINLAVLFTYQSEFYVQDQGGRWLYNE
jgi:hypothetical protein